MHHREVRPQPPKMSLPLALLKVKLSNLLLQEHSQPPSTSKVSHSLDLLLTTSRCQSRSIGTSLGCFDASCTYTNS